MRKTLSLLTVALLALLATACSSKFEKLLASYNYGEKYRTALQLYEEGKYSKAAQLFENVAMNAQGTPQEDTVRFYWGMSNYRYKEYYTAETNFAKCLQNFPRSPFAEEAAFLRIDCLYRSTLRYELDQVPSYNAINVISQYMVENPRSTHYPICSRMLEELNNRLDKKAYENALLYYRMEDYKAARVAFKNILKDDAENVYREEILYYIAKSSYKFAQLSVESKQKERYLTFVDDYYNFIGENPDSPFKREMDVLFRRSQKALGRYSGAEEDLGEKEKDFERERKKLLKQSESEEK